jgi:hypothetical protein
MYEQKPEKWYSGETLIRWLAWSLPTLIIGGCTAYSVTQMEQRFGESMPRDRVVAAVPAGDVDYWNDVKPILEQRCITCHACYDSPCQLKLSSIEGIERGASPDVVYNQSRLKPAPTSRLFEDAQTVAQWRELGFSPVLNEYSNTPEANREASVMHQILALKDANPLPEGKVLPKSFDLKLNRKQVCAKPETFDEYARKHPQWGMPYALPKLDSTRQATLLQWLEQGATYTARPPLPKAIQTEVLAWETFLNGDSLKAQLSGRYIYEHLFLAHLYFSDLDQQQFFRLVRSATPPGEPISLIATRRPYNHPGTDRVYYRLIEEFATIVVKTHMPYALDPARMQRWQKFFVDAEFSVTELPPYDQELASNPFRTFKDIPVDSRYRFMLDEAQFSIMSFIKGPVCRGQVALNVINDHFWVFFANPDDPKVQLTQDFSAELQEALELPAALDSTLSLTKNWRRYSKQQEMLIDASEEYYNQQSAGSAPITLDAIWDGDGINSNAALTVFRHFDSATVEKGLIGKPPKTAWLIDYSLLEKIHYLLVAGYDVYGNVGHQVLSRVFMDFQRMEGELNFLWLLPPEARNRELAYWYRDADKKIDQFMAVPRLQSDIAPAIDYATDDEKAELFQMLATRLAKVLPHQYDLESIDNAGMRDSLSGLEDLSGPPATLMPQIAFVEIRGSSASTFVTLLSNQARLNISSLFGEKKSRLPAEDTLTVVPGFLGAYPNAFFVVDEDEVESFVGMIASLQSEENYAALLDNYGVRRTSPKFWAQSDLLYDAYRTAAPVESGVFDFNRLENR